LRLKAEWEQLEQKRRAEEQNKKDQDIMAK
jgi:hypothetical protein